MNNEDFYYMSRPELKAVAKDRLRQPGVWWKFAVVTLIPLAIILFTYYSMYFGTAATVDLNSMSSAQIVDYVRSTSSDSVRESLLENLLQIFFVTAMSFTALDLVRNREKQFSLGQLALRCFNSRYFWSILFVDVLTYFAIQIGMILLIIPGILLTYGLSQSYFVLYDAREHGDKRDVFGILAESYRMMRGHKFDLFVLELSFIGWGLLTVITAGIAYLWVGPYMTMTKAAFYEQVRVRYQHDQEPKQDDGAL
jgi:uncharacterized membrane protein